MLRWRNMCAATLAAGLIAHGCSSERSGLFDETGPTPAADAGSGRSSGGGPTGADGGDQGGASTGGDNGSGQNGGTPGGSSSGGSAGGMAPDASSDPPGDSGTGTGSNGDPYACAPAYLEAVPVEEESVVEVPYEVVMQSVFYIMQDRSGSMIAEPTGDWGGMFGGGTAPTKWSHAVDALSAFVNDEGSEGYEVALHYFPGGGQCDGTGYDVPTVPLGELPAHATDIIDSLGVQAPNGNTPIEGALRGVTSFCAAYNEAQTARPLQDRQNCVGILITDGAPTDCNEDTQALADIAEAAFAEGVFTYAVGMEGADFAVLNAIAEAGGGNCTPADGDSTNPACDVTTTESAFTDALVTVRDQVGTVVRTVVETETTTRALECEWEMPTFEEPFAPDQVNLEVVMGGGVQSIGHVASAAGCPAGVADGWYYDDSSDPERILACPGVCDVLQGASDERVDVLVGCRTVGVP